MKQTINSVFFHKLSNNYLNIITEVITFTSSLAAATVLCNYQQAIAQVPNPTLPPDRLEDIPPTTLPSKVLPQPSRQDRLLPPPQLPKQQIPRQDDPNAKFQVDHIQVVGSTIFKPKDFAAVISPFVGRKLTFAELLQAKDAITKFYTDKGYTTTGALIPPQTLEAGVIKIQVVEGSLQEIKIVGNRRLSTNYIRDRIRLGAGKLPLLRCTKKMVHLRP